MARRSTKYAQGTSVSIDKTQTEMQTADQRVHQARALLLEAVGGQGSQRQRDGITYWTCRPAPPLTEGEGS